MYTVWNKLTLTLYSAQKIMMKSMRIVNNLISEDSGFFTDISFGSSTDGLTLSEHVKQIIDFLFFFHKAGAICV